MLKPCKLFAVLLVTVVLGVFSNVAAALESSKERDSYEANQKGVQYMEKGRLTEAVREFEKAYALNPENSVIRENLSVCYNNYAAELMGDERFLEAREYLERAVRVDPHNKAVKENLAHVYEKVGGGGQGLQSGAVGHSLDEEGTQVAVANDFLMQGIQYFEKKEYKLAKEVLEESLHFSTGSATAYELLGDIAYLEQNLAEAKESYVKAFRLKRSKTLEEKIEKVKREAPVEEKLDAYSDEHFIIRYKEEAPALFGGGFEIREYLRQAYRSVSQDLGFYPREKVVVLLYSEEEYRKLSEAPAWSGGHFDGKIRLPAYKEKANPRELQKLILHELTHSFVRDLSKGNCPTWLNEGLAEYQENKAKPIDITYFRVAEKNKYLLSMEELGKGIKEGEDAVSVYLFYQQSYMVTKYLIERYRFFKIKQMLTQFGEGKPVDEVFKDTLDMSLGVFEIKWLAWLPQAGGLRTAAGVEAVPSGKKS